MKFQSFIFCDDVRQEINGKVTLIGVYDLTIIFPKGTKFPAALPLSFFCRVQLDTGDKHFDSMKLEFFLNGKLFLDAEGPIQVNDFEKPITISQRFSILPIPESGVVRCNLIFKAAGVEVGRLSPEYSPQVQVAG